MDGDGDGEGRWVHEGTDSTLLAKDCYHKMVCRLEWMGNNQQLVF